MRFDVVYTKDGPRVESHFCREWDEHGGCYGTNPAHGVTWEEARREVARWHLEQARSWRTRTMDEEFPPLKASDGPEGQDPYRDVGEDDARAA